MEDCNKCNQTTENCECHIPDEVKHKGLHDFCKSLRVQECKYIKKEGASCSLNDNCTYPNCQEKVYSRDEMIKLIDKAHNELMNEVGGDIEYSGCTHLIENIKEYL